MPLSVVDKPIKIKDEREKDFYIIQRDLVRIAGRHIGPYGITVYTCLISHADEDKESWPGLMTIAEECGMSKPSVIQAIDQLVRPNMIQVIKKSGKHNVYRILDKKYWSFPQPVNVVDRSEDELVNDIDRLGGQPVNVVDRSEDEPVNDIDRLGGLTGKRGLPEVYKESKKESITRVSDFCGDNKPPKKNIGSQINYPEEIQKVLSIFDQDTKIAVKLFLDSIASANKTKEMSQGRYLSLLGDLKDISTGVPAEVFREAVRKATANKAHTVNYIKVILKAKADNTPAQNKAQGELPAARAKPKITYEIGKSGVWYRVEGTERTEVSEEDLPEDVLSKYRGDPPPVNGTSARPFVDALAKQMAMNKGKQEVQRVRH